jgi:hypothetical protein
VVYVCGVPVGVVLRDGWVVVSHDGVDLWAASCDPPTPAVAEYVLSMHRDEIEELLQEVRGE